MHGVWRVIALCRLSFFENRTLALRRYSRLFSIESDTHSIDGHIQSNLIKAFSLFYNEVATASTEWGRHYSIA
jgi:hypothetical protein